MVRYSCFMFIVSLLVFASVGSTKERPRAPQAAKLVRGADLVLLDGKIWTGEPYTAPGQKPGPTKYGEAVAVANGRILAVGTSREIEAYVGPNTQVINLHQHFAMPGFIDDHVHFVDGGFQLLEIDLKHAKNEDEFVRIIGEKAKTLPAGQWMQGGNWDEEAWPDAKLPTRAMIDPVTPNNPVYLSRYDGHSGLANSQALKLAGVTKDRPDPQGGVIVRDPQTHEPTGILKDAAQALVESVIPAPSDEQAEEALKAGLAEAARDGVTSVQDMNLGEVVQEIRLLRKAELDGSLTCRFDEFIPIVGARMLQEIGISHGMGSDFLKLGGVKGFADGSLGSRTAWMFDPYNDDPQNYGLPLTFMDPPSKMERIVTFADAVGIQVAIHAIGDRANATLLDIYENLGGTNAPARRFRIEHAQHVRQEDFARFGKLGVVASMQPYHAIDDGRWAEKRIGHERAGTSYAWRSVLNAGAPLAFGTDWPMAPLNPLLGVYAAVTRATLDGKHPEGWFPEQRLTVDEALRAYTQGSAYAAFEEKEKGTIAPGKLADIIVLSDDLFTIKPERIKDAQVTLTILGGKVVYQAK